MRMLHKISATIAGLVLSMATPALANHAFEAQFDLKKPVTVMGTVTKVDWKNPHAFVYIQGRDDKGKASNWAVELAPPAALTRHGWTRESLKVGDRVTAEGWFAKKVWLTKDGSQMMGARSLRMANGHELYASSQFMRADGSGAVATSGSMNKSEMKKSGK
jgi:hypothetical protein